MLSLLFFILLFDIMFIHLYFMRQYRSCVRVYYMYFILFRSVKVFTFILRSFGSYCITIGSIPSQLSTLKYLGTLDLGNNSLNGTIKYSCIAICLLNERISPSGIYHNHIFALCTNHDVLNIKRMTVQHQAI